MAITDPSELARKQAELKAFSGRMSDPEAYAVDTKDQCFDEDWEDTYRDPPWDFDVDAAPKQKSVIVYAPWPCGSDFRGEAYLGARDGVWRWANGDAIGRPVVAWMHLPPAPVRRPA